MKVLVVGSGGREHAIAWKLSQSPLLTRLYIAPGNAGMADLGILVPLEVTDGAGILAFARHEMIDLVVIGPETSLAAGVSDALRNSGIPVFGPSQFAAQLETSKTFSKQFMKRHNIPTASFTAFSDYAQACDYLRTAAQPVVIKASGLAAGKGVFLPETLDQGLSVLRDIMVDMQFGAAGNEVIIEECLSGEEVSLLAFCDGKSLAVMPPAQDHKRVLDNDEGPNTGGMGTYAPAPVLTKNQIDEISRNILQPVVDGIRTEGYPFVGVLYAGLMLTSDGPKVLEFNARFGDPETQVILPLLESDLLEITVACTRGALDQVEIRWADRSAVCVVLASAGYPSDSHTGFQIIGLDTGIVDGMVFHAGTRRVDREFVNAGGRVLGVTCWDINLNEAIQRTYKAVSNISFHGMQYRKDIGQKGLQHISPSNAYQAAGVDIDAGNRAVGLMKSAVQGTYNPRVLAGLGSFGGLFDASNLGEQPVLVASTDGVGTKVELASRLGRYFGIGEDIVNHCIDDILVQGAHPLFFLDYFATARLDPEVVAEIVTGMAHACKLADCVLLGGETAEMPGVYQENAFDVAGSIVGIVQKGKILPDQAAMSAGDILVGFASSSPHTNGYSLIRKICDGQDLLVYREELKSSLADALMASHRSYLNIIPPLFPYIKALAHITGGGFIENIPRMLPEGLQAMIDRSAWPVPALFHWLQTEGKIDQMEMYRVFNMGIGMVAVINRMDLPAIQEQVAEPVWVVGELRTGQRARVLFS